SIDEQDGPNLYAFVRNSPAGVFDKDGRDSSDAGAQTPPPKVPTFPAELSRCCDSKAISEGELELNRRFQLAKKAAVFLGLVPVNPPKYGATCKNSSADILELLTPFPKCWQCYLEERDK